MAETKPSCMGMVDSTVGHRPKLLNFKFQISNLNFNKTGHLSFPAATWARSFIGDGQRDRHRRSTAGMRFHGHFAPVRFNDAPDDGQAKAGALWPCGTQYGSERPLALFFGHADAGVFHFHHDVSRLALTTGCYEAGAYGEPATVGHGLGSVEHQVEDGLLELHGVR